MDSEQYFLLNSTCGKDCFKSIHNDHNIQGFSFWIIVQFAELDEEVFFPHVHLINYTRCIIICTGNR